MHSSPDPTRWQFSLRTLLVVMTVVAVWCMLVVALPVAISQFVVGFLWILAGGWIVTGIFFGDDESRAFCLGAAVAFSSLWTGFGGQMMQGSRAIWVVFPGDWAVRQPISLWLDLVVIGVVAVVSGKVCQWARKHFEN